MPVYSFICPTCGTRFEKRLSFEDNLHVVTCPEGHYGVKKVFSTPTVVFKGKGFYATDHRKQSGSGDSK